MNWLASLNADPLPWLLEEDAGQPGVRYFALRDLARLAPDDPELRAAREAVPASGPVRAILDAQDPAGYWVKPLHCYSPKYTGTTWSVIFLAQLGAPGEDDRVRAGCDYVLRHAQARGYGGFSALADRAPSGMVHCLTGNLCAALLELGWGEDSRLQEALDWLARSITGEGLAPAQDAAAHQRYFKGGACAPGFCCAANDGKPCAWGAIKAGLALGRMPAAQRSPVVAAAARLTVEFLLSRDPADADYPMGYADTPSRSWFQFGYPLGYVADVLQNLEALVALGAAGDPRLENALRLVASRQDAVGRWSMTYSYNGKMWSDVETKAAPSKWVTLRALRVLSAASSAPSALA
jgi:hypothetical protein